MLTDQLEKIRYGGDEAPVRRLSVRGLLPDTEHYMTYEGSTTAPACHETVTWIVQNKPIYITKQQVIFLYIFSSILFMSCSRRFRKQRVVKMLSDKVKYNILFLKSYIL